jgi:spore coat polysaccharide biosynthesis protein SpsF (cytidylyltransferase family)
MGTTLAVVEALPDIVGLPEGSPLAGIARRAFGGKSLLEWLVRRVSDAEYIAGVVVLAGDDSLSRAICKHCPSNVQVVLSAAADPLARLAAAARALPGSGLVRLNVTHPLVDPDLIDRLIATADSGACDYATFSLADGRPAIQSKLGFFAEWCAVEAVLRADRLAVGSEQRATATGFLAARGDLFSQKLIAVPRQLDRSDLRLAIHHEEDWEELQLIFDALGPESLDWQYIASLLDRQPTIRARMAERNRLSPGVC